MPGPAPKRRTVRQRRNKSATRAELSASEAVPKTMLKLPALRKWHRMTLAWWADIWKSPMASEFLQADIHGLYRLAVLIDEFWCSPTKELAGEIRLQQQAYGLTPLDRRRLEWEISRSEAEKRPRAPRAPRRVKDPRQALRAVK